MYPLGVIHSMRYIPFTKLYEGHVLLNRASTFLVLLTHAGIRDDYYHCMLTLCVECL